MMTVEERLRDAAQDAHDAARHLNDSPLPNRSRWRPIPVAVSAAVLVLLVAVPVLLLRGEGDNDSMTNVGSQEPAATSVPAESADDSADTSSIPDEVLAYWSKEGTLESVGNEPGWICPAKLTIGHGNRVTASDLPSELSFELAGHTPVRTYLGDHGPVCNQPPGVVMLAFTDQTESAATAGMTVYPSLTRFEDWCPPESCSVEGGPAEGSADSPPLDVLTINGLPAELFFYEGSFELWWVDPSGVPLYAEASGLTREQILSVANSTAVDAVTHLIEIDAALPAGLRIVHQAPSVGVWEPGLKQTDVYDIVGKDGTLIAVSARYDSGEIPLARYALNVELFELADIDGTKALWIPEGGNFLSFKSAGGVHVTIEGAVTKADAVKLAQDLSQ